LAQSCAIGALFCPALTLNRGTGADIFDPQAKPLTDRLTVD